MTRLVLAALLLLTSTRVTAGEWPQILGPNRNGVAVDERLADAWTEEGPRTVWERPVGDGFAGVAVANGRAVLFHRVDDVERAEALDLKTGEARWKADVRATYVTSYTSDGGPRCVPLIHEGRVYLYGARGNLHCVDLKTGDAVWSRDTHKDYGSKRRSGGEPPEGYFGYGSTPLVEDGKLIVNVGGDTLGAGVVAFSPETGETIWKSTDARASYSTPVAATVDGTRHLICVTRLSVVSLDPKSGAQRWEFPFNSPGPKVSAAAPLVLDGHLFVSASYEAGAVRAKIKPDAAEIVWESDDVLSSQYATCVSDGKNLYGFHGRDDIGRASLRCFDPATRKIHWTEENFGYGTLLAADAKLIILKADGELVLAERTPEAFRPLASARVLRSETRPLPALADGMLYVRDTKTLKCLDLGTGR